jgi:colicin import membrane protein
MAKRDSRQDDDEPEKSGEHRVDRVFSTREASGAVPLPRSPAGTRAPGRPVRSTVEGLSGEAELALRHQLSKLQRQLAEAQRELAQKADELSIAAEQRVAIEAERDQMAGGLLAFERRVAELKNSVLAEQHLRLDAEAKNDTTLAELDDLRILRLEEREALEERHAAALAQAQAEASVAIAATDDVRQRAATEVEAARRALVEAQVGRDAALAAKHEVMVEAQRQIELQQVETRRQVEAQQAVVIEVEEQRAQAVAAAELRRQAAVAAAEQARDAAVAAAEQARDVAVAAAERAQGAAVAAAEQARARSAGSRGRRRGSAGRASAR